MDPGEPGDSGEPGDPLAFPPGPSELVLLLDFLSNGSKGGPGGKPRGAGKPGGTQ